MPLYRSWTGALLALVYLVIATYVTQDEIRHTSGGWINLRGMGTTLITAPSQAVFTPLLKRLGLPRISYSALDWRAYSQIVFHILVSASVVYLIGAGGEWLVRRLLGR